MLQKSRSLSKRECFAVAKVGDGVKGLEMVFPRNLTWFY